MKITSWKIDPKSFVIGLLLAAAAGLFFGGTSGHAQSESIRGLAAGDGGVYLLKGDKVYWKSRDKCEQSYGCQP